MPTKPYQRKEVNALLERLSELPRSLIFVAGPRQVGKTTLVRDALAQYERKRYSFIPVDQPDELGAPSYAPTESDTYEQVGRPRDAAWLIRQWQGARAAARKSVDGYILVFDEIQKIPRWSEAVKGLWDADRAEGLRLHVVLLGSSPLLMQKGM
ncbi:MAG: hypothetical protein FD130_2091, partial [Halothiobacillaceae bacterium]